MKLSDKEKFVLLFGFEIAKSIIQTQHDGYTKIFGKEPPFPPLDPIDNAIEMINTGVLPKCG